MPSSPNDAISLSAKADIQPTHLEGKQDLIVKINERRAGKTPGREFVCGQKVRFTLIFWCLFHLKKKTLELAAQEAGKTVGYSHRNKIIISYFKGISLIAYLKKLWQGYQERQRFRKEVQRRLLKQRALKREKASTPPSTPPSTPLRMTPLRMTPLSLTGEHWTDRFLRKLKAESEKLKAGERHWTDRFLKLKAESFMLKAKGLRLGVAMFIVLWWCSFLPAAMAQDTLRPLKVGDRLPDITIENVRNYTGSSLKLSDLKGKLVILDFWATWCAPCVALIPKMEKLQNEFKGKVAFITIAYEGAREVEKFNQQLLKRGIQNQLIQVVGDVKMGAYFPHTYLPHEVWIGATGKVMAMTTEEAVNAEKIQEALNQQLRVATKIDKRIPHDINQPLFIQNNGGSGEHMLYHRTFSGFVDGLRSRSSAWVKPDGSTQITATNTSLYKLYQLAFSGAGIAFSSRNRVVFELKDSTELIAPTDKEGFAQWEINNRYCYELWAPPAFKDLVFEEMKQDLNLLFPKYTAEVQKRETPVWVLKRTSDLDKLASKGGERSNNSNMAHFEIYNAPIVQFTGMLDIKYLSLQPFPVLDETGYTGKVDLVLDASMSNVASINEALKAYDLILEKANRTIDILVIKDNPSYFSLQPSK